MISGHLRLLSTDQFFLIIDIFTSPQELYNAQTTSKKMDTFVTQKFGLGLGGIREISELFEIQPHSVDSNKV